MIKREKNVKVGLKNRVGECGLDSCLKFEVLSAVSVMTFF
jgi:hypothetical protein